MEQQKRELSGERVGPGGAGRRGSSDFGTPEPQVQQGSPLIPLHWHLFEVGVGEGVL